MITTITLNPSLDQTLTVDSLLHNVRVFAESSTTETGGKGVNVSKLLGALGVETRAFAPTGGDNGKTFTQLCKNDGIHLVSVPLQGQTRRNLTLLCRKPVPREYKINELGPRVSRAELMRIQKRIFNLLFKSSWVVLGGSPPPGIDERFYGKIIEHAARLGVKAVYDGESASLIKKHGTKIFLVKPNRHEFTLLTGSQPRHPEQFARAGRAWLEKTGVTHMLLTLDKDGAVWISRTGCWHASVPPVKIASAIGAGDSTVVLSNLRGSRRHCVWRWRQAQRQRSCPARRQAHVRRS